MNYFELSLFLFIYSASLKLIGLINFSKPFEFLSFSMKFAITNFRLRFFINILCLCRYRFILPFDPSKTANLLFKFLQFVIVIIFLIYLHCMEWSKVFSWSPSKFSTFFFQTHLSFSPSTEKILLENKFLKINILIY